MESDTPDQTPEYLSEKSLQGLNRQQKVLFAEVWEQFLNYLREEGKDPAHNVGYKDSSVRPMSRRVFQVFDHVWEHNQTVYKITPTSANQFIELLSNDQIQTSQGKEYSQSSKRKFVDAIDAYFEFIDIKWSPEVNFSDERSSLGSDPLRKEERTKLLNASMEYNSPPNYKNISPEERTRWNQYLAQKLGKPKAEISPDDWKQIGQSWKFPSLVSCAQDGGMRAALIERLSSDLVDLEANRIKVPPAVAVKNDSSWEVEISQRTTSLLRKWLDQRENIPKYDNSDKLWLNREGNPYNSRTLNPLFQKLLEQAGIEASGRRLTWYSIRHSTGMYVYDEERDLGLVAEILRQESLESARLYAHPTPESKRCVIESINGGGQL